METPPSSDESHQSLSLSFIERNAFLFAGMLVTGILASFLVYGWLTFFGSTREAGPPIAEDAPPTGKATPKQEDQLRIPEPTPSAQSATRNHLQILSQATHLSPESLPPAVKEEETTKGDAVISQFFDAKSWQDKVPHVYDSDRVKPAMEQYYAVSAHLDTKPGVPDSVNLFHVGSTVFQLRVYRDLRDGNNLEIALRRQANGSYLLDWECYVGAGAMSWDDFLRDKPAKPVLFRAYATLGDRYNNEFADAQRFLCVQLTNADRSRSFFAYCERQDTAARGLSGVLTENSLTPVTVRLSFPSGASSGDSLKMDEFVSPHWLNP